MNYLKAIFLISITALNSSCSEAKTKKEVKAVIENKSNQLQLSGFTQKQITANLFILKATSYHTNIGVYIGDDSIVLVDPMSGNNNQEQLLNAIKQLSEKPIKYVINTHHHMDHSGANLYFKNLGATIISHENTKYSSALHDVTFRDSYIITMGNETIELYHKAAHTFDDILVFFKSNNAIFMGDTYMTNSFPHFYYGGGSKGQLEIIDKALALGNKNTTIIPAHGKLTSNKQELIAYRESSLKWTNRITQLYNEGKTSDAIAEDSQIKELSTIFNNGRNVSKQSLQRTLNKTISAELAPSVTLSENKLKTFEGTYQYENGQVDEIVYQHDKLLLQSKGNYIYEVVPISETKFYVKGQFPNKHLTFGNHNKQFVFFNGNDNLVAKKN
jgi:glyoxylase-like metal-dependent hydrolase (beta-lactamase superfamily II)